MKENEEERPHCFGKLENVFPPSENGLRETPESCRPCIYKTVCLGAAIESKDGLIVKQEVLDRAYNQGLVGFWSRWSRRKTLKQKLKH